MKTFTEFLSEDDVSMVARVVGMALSRRLKGWDVSKNPGAVAIIDSAKGKVEEAKKAIDSIEGATGSWKESKAGGSSTIFRDVTVTVVDTGSAVKVVVTK